MEDIKIILGSNVLVSTLAATKEQVSVLVPGSQTTTKKDR